MCSCRAQRYAVTLVLWSLQHDQRCLGDWVLFEEENTTTSNVHLASPSQSGICQSSMKPIQSRRSQFFRTCSKVCTTYVQLFSLPDLHAATQAFCAHCFIEWLFYFSNDVFVHQTSSIITRSSTSQTLVLLHIHVVILTHLCHTLSALGISCLYLCN